MAVRLLQGKQIATASWAQNAVTSSYAQSASFAVSASWAPTQNIDTSSLVTTSSFNAFTSSYYQDSSSFSTRIDNLEQFSSSLDSTFATDTQLNQATASLSSSISVLSSSYLQSSASFSSNITQNSSSISSVLNTFNNFTSSYNTGSFSGSFTGDGAGLYNIPASGIIGLNLSQISSGSVSASISPENGLQVNANVTATSFTGSLQGVASTASFAPNYTTTSSFNSFTSSYYQDSSSFDTRIDNLEQFSSSLDATFATDTQLNQATASLSSSISSLSSSFLFFTSAYNTGSFTGSFTGSLFGTSSFTLTASFATTASFVTTAQTASFITGSNVFGPFGSNSIISASFAVSASWAPTQNIDTGSLVTTSSFNAFTSSYNTGSFTGSFTGSLFGTASYASNSLSASYALTASYSNFALTASNSQNAQDILIYVKNMSGAQIDKGLVVRISGATGDNALIATASYESDGVSANTLGITTQNIPNDSFGYVMTEGTLLGINTNSFSAGQLLYLGPTGSIIGTAPVAPLHNVRLGQVLRYQQNNGSIYVRIDNGYELGELHDVRDTSTTTSYGDLLVKSGSVWVNSNQLSGSYGLTGSLQATSFTGSLFGTSSWSFNSTTSSFVTASNVFGPFGSNSISSASFAVSSSRALSSSFATSASFAISSSRALNANNATTASYALTSSIVQSIASNISNNASNYLLSATGGGDIQGLSDVLYENLTLKISKNLKQADGIVGEAQVYSVLDNAIASGVLTVQGDESQYFSTGSTLLVFNGHTNTIDYYAIQNVAYTNKTTITLVDTSINISSTSLYVADIKYLQGNKGDSTQNLPINPAHAQGASAQALGSFSHAEGGSKDISIPGGLTLAEGSHAEGLHTIALGVGQHVQGQFNIPSTSQSAFIIGNGTDNNNRSNLVFASGSQFQVTGQLNIAPISASSTAATIVSGSGTIGGADYVDFLKVTNTAAGATNVNTTFRKNLTGDIQMVNSAYTNTVLSINDSGSITTQGNITMPNRPAFRVRGASSNNIPAGTTISGSAVTEDFNQGGHYNQTTGTFTAPIAGLYQVNVVCRTASNSNSSINQIIVRKQPSIGGEITPQIMLEWAANTTVNHMGGSSIVSMAVGDTLWVDVTVGTVQFDVNDNFSVAYIG